MKKLITLLLTLTLILSAVTLYSCDEKDPYVVYEKAYEKMEKLDSLEIDMDMKVTLSGIVTTTADYDFNIKTENAEKVEDPRLRMVGSMKMLGKTVDMDIYTEGEWCYCSISGQKYKVKVEDNANDAASDAIELTECDLPEEVFKGVEVKTEGGNKRIEVTLSGEELMEFFGEAVEGMMGGLNVGELKAASIKDAVVTVVINGKGYVSEMSLSFGMTASVSTLTFEMTVKYVDPGSKVEINAPEGLDSYTQISEG